MLLQTYILKRLNLDLWDPMDEEIHRILKYFKTSNKRKTEALRNPSKKF